jgi:hypothetical protein
MLHSLVGWYRRSGETCPTFRIDAFRKDGGHEQRKQPEPDQWERDGLTLKVEAAGFSEKFVFTYKATRCQNPKEHNLNNPRNENRKTHSNFKT